MMFFQVSRDSLDGQPTDDKQVALLDPRGNLITVSVLDSRWPSVPLKNVYEKYPGTSGAEAKQNLKKWRTTTIAFREELSLLTVGTSYDRFWCNVVNQGAVVVKHLRSFLVNGCRSYDLCEMDRSDLELHSQCASLVFLTTLQICCDRKSPILQRLLKLPFLMDFAAVFGECTGHKQLLAFIWSTCFENNRRLYTELRRYVRDIGDTILQSLEEKFTDDGEKGSSALHRLPSKDIIDLAGYVCDIVCTLQRMVLVVPDDCLTIFREARLQSRMSQFADKVVFTLNQEICDRLSEPRGETALSLTSLRLAKDKGSITEFATVDIFQRLARAGDSAEHSSSFFTELLNTVQECKRFALMFEKWSPLRQEVQNAKTSGINVEDTTVDMLIYAIKESFDERRLPWDYTAAGTPVKSSEPSGTNHANATSMKADPVVLKNVPVISFVDEKKAGAVVAEIMEMLGGMSLEKDYVKACVVHYNYDLNATVDAILSGSVPLDISRPAAVPVAPERTSPSTSQPGPAVKIDQPTNSSIPDGKVIQKVYYGKRDLYEEIEDEGVPDETRTVTIARAQKMYEDEYDDTYDEFEEGAAVVRLNEKKDQVLSDLKAMASDGDSSEDEDHDDQRNQSGQPGTTQVQYPGRGRGFPRGASAGRGFAPRGRGSSDARPTERDVGPQGTHNAGTGDQRQDPWVKQMSENYSAQVNRREGFRGAHASTGDTNTGRGRGNKEKQKARVGNHNRKDAGTWKRNQGML